MAEALAIIMAGIYLIIAVAWIVVWILTLIHQAKRKRWVWFIITILINAILIIYWIVWLFSQKSRRKNNDEQGNLN